MATGRGSADRRIAVDFVNQGSSGSTVMGHGRVEAALRKSFAGSDAVDARFVTLPSWTPLQRAASADWPPLRRFDLDLQTLRWHLVEGHRARRAVRDALRGRGPDLLHVSSHVAAFRIADLGIPYVVNVDATVDQWESMELPWHPHRRYSSRLLGLSRRLERRAFERAAAIVAMSEWSAEGVRAVMPDAEVHVIHPGLDLELYRPATAQERAEVGTDTVRVLFVGGRFEEKGGPLLLEAMAPLLGHGFELDLVTSKQGVDTPWLRYHQLPPDDARLLRLYRLADVVCLPTYRDAVPWVVPEAFASGTPVVVSEVGALPGLAGADALRGVVLPAGDVVALGNALRNMGIDAAGWSEKQRAGREHALSRFDMVRQADRLITLMQEPGRV